MTVRELIRKLEDLPEEKQDLEVCYFDVEYGATPIYTVEVHNSGNGDGKQIVELT